MGNNFLAKIFNNEIVRIIFALVLVGVLSGAVLVFIYNYSMPKIKVNIQKETEKAINTIFPGAASNSPTKDKGVYSVKDSTGKVIGYAFIAEGNGYQGLIKLLAGADAKISILKGIEVLESSETPGLGAEINTESFQKQFVGLPLTHDIEYVKNQKPEKPYQVEAITGATISSRAVVNILNGKINEIKKTLK